MERGGGIKFFAKIQIAEIGKVVKFRERRQGLILKDDFKK